MEDEDQGTRAKKEKPRVGQKDVQIGRWSSRQKGAIAKYKGRSIATNDTILILSSNVEDRLSILNIL